MQISSFLTLIAQVYCVTTAGLAKASFAGFSVAHAPQHINHFRGPVGIVPMPARPVRSVLAMAHPDREVHDVASAIAHNFYELPRTSSSSEVASQSITKVAEIIESAEVKAVAGNGRVRGSTPFTASLARPPINFDDVLFDEAAQTYTIPAALMEPYKKAILGARAKVKEDEAARFIRQNPVIGNIIGQGAMEGVFTVGLQVICVMINSPFQPISNFAVKKLAGLINGHPTPEIAEKFFRGQCNHAGIEHTLWLRKMKGKLRMKI